MRDMGPILAEREKFIRFVREVISVAFEGGDLDGGTIQEMGVKYGFLKAEEYDPVDHGEVDYMESGDTIYVYQHPLNLPQALDSTAQAQADKGGI